MSLVTTHAKSPIGCQGRAERVGAQYDQIEFLADLGWAADLHERELVPFVLRIKVGIHDTIVVIEEESLIAPLTLVVCEVVVGAEVDEGRLDGCFVFESSPNQVGLFGFCRLL